MTDCKSMGFLALFPPLADVRFVFLESTRNPKDKNQRFSNQLNSVWLSTGVTGRSG